MLLDRAVGDQVDEDATNANVSIALSVNPRASIDFICRGNATLASDGQFVIVSNLHDGISQYRFPTMELVQSYSHPILRNYCMQVAASSCNSFWVACGGDDGFARLYQADSQQQMYRLEHSSGSYLRTGSNLSSRNDLWQLVHLYRPSR